jgi:integrase
MARNRKGTPPRYRLHRPTGQAVVTLDGHDNYLGRYGSSGSHTKYERLIKVWRKRRDQALSAPPAGDPPPLVPEEPTVNAIALAYIHHAKRYYRPSPEGEQKEVGCIRDALKIVRRLHGRNLATDFGPKALKGVRKAMLAKGWSRSYTNHQVDRIRRMFRWATEEELISATVYHALRAVRGLRKGLPGVREAKKVRPVRPSVVKQVLAHLQPMVRAMILFQYHTGCRPSEVCRLRPRQVTRTGEVWVYRPSRHKTAHHGKKRKIYIGPRAQKVLEPWLEGAPPDDFVFSPIRAEAMRQAERRAARTTPLWPSHLARLEEKRKEAPKRPKRKRYDTASYRRAIKRACKAAKAPAWSPNQLRHTAATRIRKEHGIEVARIILGHSTAFTTEIYAEVDRKRAVQVIGEMG